jgi:hypothetical protein
LQEFRCDENDVFPDLAVTGSGGVRFEKRITKTKKEIDMLVNMVVHCKRIVSDLNREFVGEET